MYQRRPPERGEVGLNAENIFLGGFGDFLLGEEDMMDG